MATNPNTGQQSRSTGSSKNKFWSKLRGPPKHTPRRKRGTSDSTLVVPPPALPLPRPTLTPTKKTTPPPSSDNVFVSYNCTTEEMTLSEFAQRYQSNLPQQVVVTHGVYWRENMEVNISSSERLNIHFIRHRESVKIKELGGGTEYSVPVTSTLEFGPVYNPYNGHIKDALRGFFYPTVGDIVKIIENAPLPKLICATSKSSMTAPANSVSRGELLLIKEVRSDKHMGFRELHVTSLTTNTDKILHESCRGNFTTRPEAIKLSLFSIIKYIPNALPLSVMIFPRGDTLDQGDMHYPSHLFHKVIQLSRTFTDVLLVASSVPEDSVCNGREPFEIPQEVELELRVVELREGDREQLQEKSDTIMRKIQGEYVKQYRNAHQAQAEYVVQEMFLKAVGGLGDEKENIPVASPRRKIAMSVEKEEDSDYPNVSPVQEGVLSRLGKLEEVVWKMKKSRVSTSASEDRAEEERGGEAKERVGKETASVVGALEEEMREKEEKMREKEKKMREKEEEMREKEKKVEALEATVSELRSLLEEQQKSIQEELGRMSVELVAMREEMKRNEAAAHQQGTSPYQHELLGSPETAQRNSDIVKSLTRAQVLQLLAEVGVEDLLLATQENVSGDILVELNEEELETELGIRKKIPRLKIMKIINGSKPVTDYLKMSEPNSMDIVC